MRHFKIFLDIEENIKFMEGEIGGGGIAGIVAAWIVGAPAILFAVKDIEFPIISL